MVINVQVFDDNSMDIARAKMIDLLRERHRLSPDQENDFTIQTQAEVAEAATETSRVMTWLLASIAGISLFVGGIGIMNEIGRASCRERGARWVVTGEER